MHRKQCREYNEWNIIDIIDRLQWLEYNEWNTMHEKQCKQAGAELCQAQAHVGLPAEAELMLSFMEVPSIFSKLF